jgi:hypothetical protein
MSGTGPCSGPPESNTVVGAGLAVAVGLAGVVGLAVAVAVGLAVAVAVAVAVVGGVVVVVGGVVVVGSCTVVGSGVVVSSCAWAGAVGLATSSQAPQRVKTLASTRATISILSAMRRILTPLLNLQTSYATRGARMAL